MRRCIAWCVLASVAAAGCGGGDDGTGGMGGSSSTSSIETTAGGSGGADSTRTTGGSGGADSCAPPSVLSVLGAYLKDLHGSAELLGGHPSAIEGVGFFLAPGVPAPPANVASYYTLIMPCSAPTKYDPYCDQGKCSQLECPGSDAGWANHLWLDSPPKTFGDFTFQEILIDISWAEGAAGITFDTAVLATGPGGTDWSLSGSGAMEGTSVALQADLPGLFPDGPTALAFEADVSSAWATIVVQGVTIAELGASGDLVATGACP